MANGNATHWLALQAHSTHVTECARAVLSAQEAQFAQLHLQQAQASQHMSLENEIPMDLPKRIILLAADHGMPISMCICAPIHQHHRRTRWWRQLKGASLTVRKVTDTSHMVYKACWVMFGVAKLS